MRWLAAAILTVTVSGQDARPAGHLERPFTANGTVKMNLVAGDYRISGGRADRVRIDWRVRDAEALAKVELPMSTEPAFQFKA